MKVIDLSIDLWEVYRKLSDGLVEQITMSEFTVLYHIDDLLKNQPVVYTSDLRKRSIFPSASLMYLLNALAMRSLVTLRALKNKSFSIKLTEEGISTIKILHSKQLKPSHMVYLNKLHDIVAKCLNK